MHRCKIHFAPPFRHLVSASSLNYLSKRCGFIAMVSVGVANGFRVPRIGVRHFPIEARGSHCLKLAARDITRRCTSTATQNATPYFMPRYRQSDTHPQRLTYSDKHKNPLRPTTPTQATASTGVNTNTSKRESEQASKRASTRRSKKQGKKASKQESKAKQSKAKQSNARQGEARQSKATQSKAKHASKARQSKATQQRKQATNKQTNHPSWIIQASKQNTSQASKEGSQLSKLSNLSKLNKLNKHVQTPLSSSLLRFLSKRLFVRCKARLRQGPWSVSKERMCAARMVWGLKRAHAE